MCKDFSQQKTREKPYFRALRKDLCKEIGGVKKFHKGGVHPLGLAHNLAAVASQKYFSHFFTPHLTLLNTNSKMQDIVHRNEY